MAIQISPYLCIKNQTLKFHHDLQSRTWLFMVFLHLFLISQAFLFFLTYQHTFNHGPHLENIWKIVASRADELTQMTAWPRSRRNHYWILEKKSWMLLFNPVFQQKSLLLYWLQRGWFSIIFSWWSTMEMSYRFIPSLCIHLISTASYSSCFSGHVVYSDGWLINLVCPSNRDCICCQKSTGLNISMLKDNLDH